jgi:hypothetical protein
MTREDFLRSVRKETRGNLLPFPQSGLPLPEPACPSDKGGRPRQSEQSKRYFKIGQMVEEKIASGDELTAARRLVALETHISYGSVVRYHKQYRGVQSPRDRNPHMVSITG